MRYNDLRVFPDLYNTGCNGTFDKRISESDFIDNKDFLTITANGVRMREIIGSNGEKRLALYVADGDNVVIENMDLCHASDGTEVHHIYFTSFAGKNATYSFKNCYLPGFSPCYSSLKTENPDVNIKVKMYDCTCHGCVDPEYLYAERCQFIGNESDCLRALVEMELHDCYAYQIGNYDYTGMDTHIDVLQTTSRAGLSGRKLTIDNCNFCEPCTPTQQLSGCFMGDLDYSDFNGLDIKSLYANGSGYTIALLGGGDSSESTAKPWRLNGNIEKCEIGYGGKYTQNLYHYKDHASGVTGRENIVRCHHPYIGTVKKNGNDVTLYVTNYLDQTASIAIRTDSKTDIRTVEAYPSYETTSPVGSGYNSIDDFPVNVPVSFQMNDGDTFVEVVHDGVIIRTVVYGESSDAPTTDGDKVVITKSKITAIADAIRSASDTVATLKLDMMPTKIADACEIAEGRGRTEGYTQGDSDGFSRGYSQGDAVGYERGYAEALPLVPEGYLMPSGTYNAVENNSTPVDIGNYKYLTVNVPIPSSPDTPSAPVNFYQQTKAGSGLTNTNLVFDISDCTFTPSKIIIFSLSAKAANNMMLGTWGFDPNLTVRAGTSDTANPTGTSPKDLISVSGKTVTFAVYSGSYKFSGNYLLIAW